MTRRRLSRRVSPPLAVVVALLALGAAAGIVYAVATAGDLTVNLNEDDTSVAVGLTGTTDTADGSLTYTVTGEPTHGTIDEGAGATGTMPCSSGNCTATIHYTPTADYFGDDSFTYKVTDTDGDSLLDGTVTLHIAAVNDAPTFSNSGGVEVNEDSGAYSAGWATAIDPGPNEGSQTVSFSVTGNDNASLFSVAPAVASDGTLTFTPAANANGVAHMTVTAQDDGGTTNGGHDTSGGASLTITVDAVNDPPTFTKGPDEVVNHDSGAFTATGWATSISPGPGDESGQTVSFSFTADDNASLFSVAPAVASDGTLTFTVAAGHTGTANLTLEAQDTGGTTNGGDDTSAGAAVVIRVNANPNAVNDSATVGENAVASVIDVLANDTSLPDPPEVLTVASVSNDGVNGPLHGVAAVSVTNDSVTYTPTAGYYGSDFFRYTITDPYGGTDFATVFVTITKDTTAPTTSLPVEGIKSVSTMTSTSLSGFVTWTGSDAGVGIAHYDLQRSLDGGAYTTLTLSSPTATSLAAGFGVGHSYQFRVRAVDRNGNVGAWMTGPKFVQARYQETSGFLKYSTGWTFTSNTSDSGGGAKYATLINKYATFTHVMRDVAFVGPRSATRGSFDVYIDGVKVGAGSMKTTTTHYQQVTWQFHFSKIGTHTIKIVLRGNGRVDLDCFVILD